MKKFTLGAITIGLLLFAGSSLAWFGNGNNWGPWGGNNGGPWGGNNFGPWGGNNNGPWGGNNWGPWGGNNFGPWGGNRWGNNWNPYDEWDPRYWMEEMEDFFDDDDYYGGYGPYGPGYGGYGPGYGGYGPGYGGYGPGNSNYNYRGPAPYGYGQYPAQRAPVQPQAPGPRE